MLERFLLSAASFVRRRPLVLLAIAVVAAAGLAAGIPRLKFQTGQDTLLDPSSKIARDNAAFQQQFGGDPMLGLFEAPEGTSILQLFTKDNRAALQRVELRLQATGDYQSILTPLTILQFAQQTIQAQMKTQPAKLQQDLAAAGTRARADSAARGESPAQQDAAAAAAEKKVTDAFNTQYGADAQRFAAIANDQSFDNPKFLEFVLYGADGKVRPELAAAFPDNRHALMVVRMKGNLSFDDSSRVAENVVTQVDKEHFDGVSAMVTGPPLLVKEINDKMKSSLVLMAAFAVVIMVVVLWVIFRARWRLLSLPAVLVGCVSAFGLMGFAGIPLTIVTISGLPILIGLGVDFAIQLHSRIEDETLRLNSAERGLEAAFIGVGPALLLALVAGCIGFLVLRLASVPMIRDFGSMLAVGAVLVFIMSLALVGGVLYLRERQRLGPRDAPHARFEVERLVGGLTARTVGRIAPIAVIATVVALGGLYLGRKIPTQTDPEKFVTADSSVLQDLHHVRDVSGSTDELDLFVTTEGGKKITDQDVLSWMLPFERREMKQHATLRTSNSLASFTESVTGTPPTTTDAQSVLASAPQALRAQVVSDDGSSGAITFAIGGNASLSDRKAMTQAIINDANPPPGVSVAPAGIAVVGTATVDAVSHNRDLMTFVAVIAILVVLLVAFRNPVRAISPLLPVVLALGASSMLLYLSGIEYSPLTSISGPLIIAMGTEFNILLMSRYFEERATGLTPREAMSRASLRIGRAITASGLTVMGGFAVLAFSDFPLLDNFGKVTALNIGLSLLSTLVLLPPLLVWADEGHRVGETFEPEHGVPEHSG
ncbi:MAG TPA: hydrophobe/amphiphile efflux-3 (HAE3) family transporter [Dehalococcoidia bacterium]|nr:hydrophobe/amphiphile efflux-3 (HAE3) family transporter [Dehalococcoidia bacterium]